MKRHYTEAELKRRRDQYFYDMAMTTGAFVTGRYAEAIRRLEDMALLIRETWGDEDDGEDTRR